MLFYNCEIWSPPKTTFHRFSKFILHQTKSPKTFYHIPKFTPMHVMHPCSTSHSFIFSFPLSFRTLMLCNFDKYKKKYTITMKNTNPYRFPKIFFYLNKCYGTYGSSWQLCVENIFNRQHCSYDLTIISVKPN